MPSFGSDLANVFSKRASALAALLLWLAPSPGLGAVIGYWRMEADLDPTPDGFEVANEVAFGTALLSSEAFVDTDANPNASIPLTGMPNAGSAGATIQGGDNGINATAGWYAALDTASLSLEYWARTGESTATLLSRSSGSNGIRIWNPNALNLTYYVDDGAGGSTPVSFTGLDDMSATEWRHYAFTYDAATGVGRFYVDGVEVTANDGPDGRALAWGSQVDLEVGHQMDYAAAFNGTLDELRLTDGALTRGSFLAPEPGSGALVGLGLLGIALWRRPRRRGPRS